MIDARSTSMVSERGGVEAPSPARASSQLESSAPSGPSAERSPEAMIARKVGAREHGARASGSTNEAETSGEARDDGTGRGA